MKLSRFAHIISPSYHLQGYVLLARPHYHPHGSVLKSGTCGPLGHTHDRQSLFDVGVALRQGLTSPVTDLGRLQANNHVLYLAAIANGGAGCALSNLGYCEQRCLTPLVK